MFKMTQGLLKTKKHLFTGTIQFSNVGRYNYVTRDDSQRRFSEQPSVETLLRHCFKWLQHCSNIATLCCAKNCCCESSRVTSP